MAEAIYPRDKVEPAPLKPLKEKKMAEIKEVGNRFYREPASTYDRLVMVEEELKELAKADPQELHRYRTEAASVFHLASRVWNDAYAPALATRFDSDG